MKLSKAFTVVFIKLLVIQVGGAIVDPSSSSCVCGSDGSNDSGCKTKENGTCGVPPISEPISFQQADEPEPFQCGIYLAMSSIPFAGFGIYTTREVKRGETVQPYPEAPSIPVFDFYDPFGAEEEDWNHVNYIWEAEGMTGFEALEMSESVMTFGSLCNFHTVLKSLSPHSPEYDDTILSRYEDPGAGAISYYNGRKFEATRHIEAGEELFDDYGSSWLDNRPGTYADFVPRSEDFDKAAQALAQVSNPKQNYEFKFEDAQLSLIADTISVFNTRAASVFPNTREKYEHFRNITVADLKKKQRHVANVRQLSNFLSKSNLQPGRDVNWIIENGLCLEKMKPGRSTISGAGRGGFAQMAIKVGEIVTPAPLLNVPNKDSLLIYEAKYDKNNSRRVKVGDEPIGQQLLVNYCFGHRDSQLLLCPQTNSILINHCSKRKGGNLCNNGNGPNAKVRWASGWDPATDEWLQKSVPEIAKLTADGQRGLSLEIVATTDIAPGDEIFIDYGENWENAWNNHVDNWEPPKKADDGSDYVPLAVLDANKDDLRTNEERKTNPYPQNVQMCCYGGRIIDDDEEGEVEYDDDEVEMTADDSFQAGAEDMDDPDNLLHCDIVEYNEAKKKYTVHIYHRGIRFIVRKFPKKSVRLTLKPYTSDLHLEGAFRHFMEIDDDIFPVQWKRSAQD